MLKYEVYEKGESGSFEFTETMEFEASDLVSLKQLKKISRNPEFYVQPVDDENLEASIYYLQASLRRGNAKLSADNVVKIFKLKAKENLSAFLISVRLQEEDDVTMSPESVRNVLKRKTYSYVVVPEEYLERIESNQMTSMRKRRKAITPEDKPKILKLHDSGNGLAGREIAQLPEFDYSSATVIAFLTKELGYMDDGKRPGR